MNILSKLYSNFLKLTNYDVPINHFYNFIPLVRTLARDKSHKIKLEWMENMQCSSN